MDTISDCLFPSNLLPTSLSLPLRREWSAFEKSLGLLHPDPETPFPPVQRRSSPCPQPAQPQRPSSPESPLSIHVAPVLAWGARPGDVGVSSLWFLPPRTPLVSSASSYFSILSLSFDPLSALNPYLKGLSQSFLPSLHPSRAISSASVASVTIHKPMVSKAPPGWLSLLISKPIIQSPTHVSIYPYTGLLCPQLCPSPGFTAYRAQSPS